MSYKEEELEIALEYYILPNDNVVYMKVKDRETMLRFLNKIDINDIVVCYGGPTRCNYVVDMSMRNVFDTLLKVSTKSLN